MRRATAGVGGDFNPETDITWHSLFWAEGTDFVAEGYADTNDVTTWPNETGQTNATEVTDTPTYDAVNASFNNQPTVAYGDDDRLGADPFSVAPTYPISIVAIGNVAAGGARYVFGGNDADHRTDSYASGGEWRMTRGGTTVGAGTQDSLPHLFVMNADSTDTLTIDGVGVLSGNSGPDQIEGLILGHYFGTADASVGGNIALIGIYEGDITADGSWSDFETWAEDHYGLTIA